MPESDMRESLGRIEGKLDIIVPLVKSHDKRISKVEKKNAWFSGGLAFLVMLVGAVGMLTGFSGK